MTRAPKTPGRRDATPLRLPGPSPRGRMPSAVPGLGPLESAVMDVLWQADRPLKAQNVVDRISYPRAISYSSVTTVLTNLIDKHLVARRQGGGGHFAYLYEAAVSRDRHLAGIVAAALRAADDRPAVISLATALAEGRQGP